MPFPALTTYNLKLLLGGWESNGIVPTNFIWAIDTQFYAI